jgi:drug/metabolite transporter (DMT)-like permease
MRPLAWIGIVLLALGILAFVVPVPSSHSHSVKVGDASIGVTTHSDEKLSPIVGGVLCAAGVVLVVAGSRKSTA